MNTYTACSLATIDSVQQSLRNVRIDPDACHRQRSVSQSRGRERSHAVVARGSTPAAIDHVRRQSEAAAAEKLALAVRGAKISRVRQHVVGRHVPDAIEEVAIRSRSPLVVMGAIARTGLTRLLIGNTAERVLDHLSCDVLVVKPSQRVTRRRGASEREQAKSHRKPIPAASCY